MINDTNLPKIYTQEHQNYQINYFSMKLLKKMPHLIEIKDGTSSKIIN